MKGRKVEKTFRREEAAFIGTGRVSRAPLLRVRWLLGQAGVAGMDEAQDWAGTAG